MSVERLSARLPIKKPPTAHTQVYAYGGKGNARLISFSIEGEEFVSYKATNRVDLGKISPTYFFPGKPMTVNRIGKIIRRVEKIT